MPASILRFTDEARSQLAALEQDKSQAKHLKAVRKALGYLQVNPRHPSLETHEFESKIGPNGEKVFEAYAENRTPGAYRIFFYYGPGRGVVSVVTIIPHP